MSRQEWLGCVSGARHMSQAPVLSLSICVALGKLSPLTLCLSFFICKRGIIIVPTHGVILMIKSHNI